MLYVCCNKKKGEQKMKFFKKGIIISTVAAVSLAVFSVMIYAYSAGISGRTKKTTTSGCSCHNAAATTDVTVTISGPDSVTVNQTQLYTLTVTKASKTGAGLDVAAKNGTLSAVSSTVKLLNGEIVNNTNIPMTSGTVTIQFNYTAPSTAGIDSLYATGLATNSGGTTSGDDWNFAPGKKIVVRNSIGIQPVSSEIPGEYRLAQNYPNPFNPTTKIAFEIPKGGFVSLKVYDITGKEVYAPVAENLQAGKYSVDINAGILSSGVYFYSLRAGDFQSTKKMTMLK